MAGKFANISQPCVAGISEINRQYGVTVNSGFSRMVLGETYDTRGQAASIMADIIQKCGDEVKDMTYANLNELFVTAREKGGSPAVNLPPR